MRRFLAMALVFGVSAAVLAIWPSGTLRATPEPVVVRPPVVLNPSLQNTLIRQRSETIRAAAHRAAAEVRKRDAKTVSGTTSRTSGSGADR